MGKFTGPRPLTKGAEGFGGYKHQTTRRRKNFALFTALHAACYLACHFPSLAREALEHSL